MLNSIKTHAKFYFVLIIAVLVAIGLQSCAPVFSEMQSARTVGDNRIEFTPSFSSTNFFEDGEKEEIQNHIAIRTAYGVNQNFDIRGRVERVWLKDGGIEDGTTIMSIGPKFSLIENNIAFFLPIGTTLNEDFNENTQLHPTLLFTLPAVPNRLDITLSPKYLITFCEDCDDYVAANLGASFSDDLNKWAIRAEYGLLFNPGETGYYGQFSIGFSAAFGK